MANPVYLDYNATAPVKPAVIEVMAETMASVGNPSSVHGAGRAARQRLARARQEVAALTGASPDTVTFTSGGTEANNQALRGQGKVAVSAIEHPSVLALADEGCIAPVDGEGLIDLDALGNLLDRARPDLLAVMLANNETGVIQPIRAIASIARGAGIRLHVDAIQAAGKIPLDIEDLGADTLSLSAHKLGGPQGVGALVHRPGGAPVPLLHGGAQEARQRAGTENLPGIVGFGKAASLALGDEGFAERVRHLRDHLEAVLADIVPELRVASRNAPRLPNTSCIILPGLSHETQLIHFDLAGIAVSAGSACSSGRVGPSPVLTAMGLSLAEAEAAIRVSFGWNSGGEDRDRLIKAYDELYRRHASRRSA